MAFDPDGFSVDGRASGVRSHTYSSADAIADVNSEGYFNRISGILKVRDIIDVVDTATPTTYRVSVLSNAAGVVDVDNGTLTAAETDGD